MPNRLFDLFDENTVREKDLVASSPRTLAQMTASGSADPDALQTQVDLTNQVVPKVDYSDFSKFVFFNSALDYFNISGERMLNEWPYDGLYSDQLSFMSESDGYQRHLLDVWPAWSGGAVFVTGAFVRATDAGFVSQSIRTGLLAPGTSSVSVEFHAYIPQFPTGNFFVLQDASGSSSNYQVTISSGSLSYRFGGDSGTFAGITTGSWYMALTFDQAAHTVSFYTKPPQPNGYFDQLTPIPFMPLSATRALTSSVTVPSASTVFTVGSGTSPSDWSGICLSELRVWTQVQSDAALYANYNTRVYQQQGLQLYWRFAEGMSGSQVKDYSGHKINGSIYGSAPALFWTGSFNSPQNQIMSPQDTGEYTLNLVDAGLSGFIAQNQVTATIYDRNNAGIITGMVPFMYLYLEDERNTEVLKNLLYLLARQFDEIKVLADQIPHLLNPSYTGHDETPDALLAEVLKFWGWDTKANFLSEDAFRYFFGYDVLMQSGTVTGSGTPQAIVNNQATYDNQRLDITLDKIKKEFWHRTLQELIYIYKKKGTREAVEALLRVYGLDEKIVKLKEFGVRPNAGIETHRISSNRSTWTRVFASGSPAASSSAGAINNSGTTDMNMTVSFPTASLLSSGTVFYVSDGTRSESLTYSRQTGSSTGTLSYLNLTSSAMGIFDGRWYSISTHRSGTVISIHVQHLDEDTIDLAYSTGSVTGVLLTGALGFGVGPGEFRAMNAQVWNMSQSWTDITDHTLNPFSFGAETPEQAQRLELNWMFDWDADQLQQAVFDQTVHHNNGQPFSGTFDRELFGYNFIAAPDYGWSEEKIRYSNSVRPAPDQTWLDSNVVSLEFNLIDALNEDISYMISSLDNWNNLIGGAANRYRGDYPSLERFRSQYFNRLQGRINFRAFADFMDFFDRSFVELVRKLLPARSNFKGAEFVVENHMLERPKVQYTYRRRNPELVPEGVIRIYSPYPWTWTP